MLGTERSLWNQLDVFQLVLALVVIFDAEVFIDGQPLLGDEALLIDLGHFAIEGLLKCMGGNL